MVVYIVAADDIIRQHKAACLRITALLVCKDLLWIGTSAGVILTIPMPRITSTTTRGNLSVPNVTGKSSLFLLLSFCENCTEMCFNFAPLKWH